MSVEVRALHREELALAPALLAPEGWSFEVAELERLHRLGGAAGAFRDGALVGFLSWLDLPPVRWVGNVVVHPAARGAGVAARLVALAGTGAATVGLYSVEKAVPLYERAGFVAHGEAWAHRAERATARAPAATQPMTRDDLLDAARLDRATSGMDRGLLLRELHAAYPDASRIVRRQGRVVGFGIAKTSPGLTELGPIVAEERAVAAALLDDLVARTPGPHEATVLGAAPHALADLRARGFAPTFRTVVMFRGAPPAWRPAALAAAAGLEKG